MESKMLFRSVDIKFNVNPDITFEFVMGLEMSAERNGTMQKVFYDELYLSGTADATMADDVVYIKLQGLELDVAKTMGDKGVAWEDDLLLSEAEYRELISNFDLYMNYLRKYLNNVYFKKGLKMPYNSD